MRVTLSPDAEETLHEVSEFIDAVNTDGAGQFWITNFILNLYTYAKPNVTYALCRQRVFADEGLSCITYNGWVIAFKIEGDQFYVYYIIRGSVLLE